MFSSAFPAVFPRQEYPVNVIPCSVLVVVHNGSFIPAVRQLWFLLFDGGVLRLFALCEAGLLAPVK
jgi:hypothetical protein